MTLLVFAVLAMVVNDAGSDLGEWHYDARAETRSISVDARTCYDEPGKHTISLNWSDDEGGKTATVQCGCGEALELNDKAALITAESLPKLLADGLAPALKTYRCIPDK